ncbi:MAG TPA: molybdopterin dinucleotide binding domain-containing protein, partial [Anaeromyxobacteraceae bacterium]|nr:molybdopterin dinucleotide binding domain-containing protein [Anaeromyxobacteraceae bacterium]
PVSKPRHDTRDAAEVLAALGRGVGGPPGKVFPWPTCADALRQSGRGIHRSGRGALFDVPEAEAWIVTMETNGWRASSFGSFDEFWEGLKARGGWWDPVYDFGERGRVVRTASRKLEFAPLARTLAPGGPRDKEVVGAVPVGTGARPLRLHLYPLLAAFGDSQGPIPWVQDVLGHELGQSWGGWVELSPADARALGVEDGSRVVIESVAGSLEARAKVWAGVFPGVAAMPVGPGGAPGRACRRALSAGVGALAGPRTAGGRSVDGDVWVRVRRA